MTYGAGGGGAQGQGYGIAGSPGIIIIDEYTGSTTQAGYAISNSNSFNSVSGVEILGPAESPDVIDE
ncbi:MAG: hypothetical protein LBQ00_06880 [Syntrophobacterales bacterium]|jgi:hypothetical protein|nr:hypothetical protein [Syntrophobacterales bacterium]